MYRARMRSLPIVALTGFFALACSGSNDDPVDSTSGDPSSGKPHPSQSEFPAELLPEALHADLHLVKPEEGDLVVFTDIIEDIQPGDDVTFCTFADYVLEEPFMFNVALGSQSNMGHHAILQYTTTPVEPGTRKCDRSEMDGQILMGGTAGKEVGTAVDVPPEVAVEIPAGSQLVINHHYINTGTEPVDSQSMIVARAHRADETVLAGQMIMGSMGWEIAPQSETTETTEVVFGDDMAFFMTAGHMHEWGSLVTVEVERAGGEESVMAVDQPWTEELAAGEQEYNLYPIDEPFVIHKGDTVRLTCQWENDTDEMIEFPREMCFFVGYTVDGKNNYAFNGMWIDPDTIDRDEIDTSDIGH